MQVPLKRSANRRSCFYDLFFKNGGVPVYIFAHLSLTIKVSVLTVYTPEEMPSIHIPQEGEPLYMALGGEHMENIQTDLPVKIILWIDRMGAHDVAESKDRATIEQLVDAFSKIEKGNGWATWDKSDTFSGKRKTEIH